MNNTFLPQFLEITPAALALVRSIESALFNEMPLSPPVLDIGCGDGLFANISFRNRLDAGVDLDFRELLLAKKTDAYKDLFMANAANLPFARGSFQTVMSNCVFEHVRKLQQAFEEIHRILKPGGRYIFTAHSDLYNQFLFWPELLRALGLSSLGNRYCLMINSVFRHFNCFSPEHWTALLNDAGFKDVEWKYYLTKKTLQRFDQLLPLSIFSYPLKKLSGKWVILPRFIRPRIFQHLLSSLCENQEGPGAAIFLIAHK